MAGKRGFWRIILGAGLIVLGIAAILQTYNIISGGIWAVIFTVLFCLAGVSFLVHFMQDHQHWWAIIPGFMLIGIAATIGLAEFTTGWLSNLAGAVFMISAALAFLVVYLVRRDFWWALIPGFIMAGLSAMIVVEETSLVEEDIAAGIFLGSIGLAFLILFLIKRDFWWALIPAGTMAGVSLLVAFNMVAFLFLAMAITFGILGFMRSGKDQMTWAWIPGGVLFIMAILFFVSEAGASFIGTLILPAILILVGIYILARVIFKRS